MTDFYSVLKDSIIRRNLISPAARYDVYAQAREAMVRRLWSLEPPLSEDEIDARIGLFDAAVERIESDFEKSSDAAEELQTPSSRYRSAQPSRQRKSNAERSGEGRAENYDDRRSSIRPPPRHRTEAPPSPDPQRERAHRPSTGGRELVATQSVSRGPRATPSANGASATERRNAANEDWRTPNGTGTSKPRLKPSPAERIRPRAARQRTYPDDSYAGADFEDDVGQYEENVGSRRRKPTIAESPPTAGNDAALYSDHDYRQNGYADEADQYHPVEDAAYYEYDGREPQRNDVYQEAGQYEDVYVAPGIDDDYGYDRGPAPPRQTGRRRTGKNPRSDREHRTHHDGGHRRLPILAIALAVIAIILLAVNAFVFIPILMGSEPEEATATSAAEKVDDRLPSIISSGEANAATIPSSSATAIEVPQRNLNVAESIEIFTGSDPTVFEASSNNPIQFESDSEGGFARISSGASAAGARVVIGPGIADRIAGQTIRVTMLARSSQQNGATNMRFALQSGLAISHWQSADLSSNYGNYGMMWHVPTARTAAGDFLLIEPGIPGDGTSTDIRMIKIDIIDS